MKNTLLQFVRSAVAAAFLAGGMASASTAPDAGVQADDFVPLAKQVIRLLETGGAASFAASVAPSTDDWKAAAGTNEAAIESVSSPGFQRRIPLQRSALESAAGALVSKASELKVDFAKMVLTPGEMKPGPGGQARVPGAEDPTMPFVSALDVVIKAAARPGEPEAAKFEGEYKVTLRMLMKFPDGWRCDGGIQWAALPAGVVDEKTQLELQLLTKAAGYEGITMADDPALGRLAEALAEFIRRQDAASFESKAALGLEDVVRMFENTAQGRQLPPRSEIEKQWAVFRDRLVSGASAILAGMEAAGIDLKDSDIKVKDVRIRSTRSAGSIEGLMGEDATFVFDVKSQGKSKTGQSLTGEYVLATRNVTRANGRWFVSDAIRWQALPQGVVPEEIAATIATENQIVESGTLPVGLEAPDFEFTLIDSGEKKKLSDFRGKVVVVDFWATWCGPCQEPMAKLQTYGDAHPEWKDKVILMSVSIDEEMKTAKEHLQKNGWTKSLNVWVPGAWASDAIKAYRVQGIPTCYLVGVDGKIAGAGHPAGMRLADMVNGALKKE